jgi:uncharacterized coiled-coil protein SlyX
MGLFGPSKSDLEDRIEELESEVSELHTIIECTAEDRRKDVERLNERVDGLVEALNTALAPDFGDDLKRVPDESGTVERIMETRVAYKATSNAIVELHIPAGAQIVYPEGLRDDKLRTDMAVVSGFYDPDDVREYVEFTDKQPRAGSTLTDFDPINTPTSLAECDQPMISDESKYQSGFEYHIGEVVTPDDDLNQNPKETCASGIHFFRTLEGALSWY